MGQRDGRTGARGNPVIRGTRYVLVHAPDLVRYGSKPLREVAKAPETLRTIQEHLRPYESALAYPPNQAFVGGMDPDALASVARPWYEQRLEGSSRWGPYGEVVPEDEFYGLLRVADQFDLVWLEDGFLQEVRGKLSSHPLVTPADLSKLVGGKAAERIEAQLSEPGVAIPLYVNGGRLVGCVNRGHEEDTTLNPVRLLENLACKVTAALALRSLMSSVAIAPESMEFLLGCGEEAIGDRYNPGGGNLAKAAGEMAGCTQASGADIKDFCCAPAQAVAIGGGLVLAGLHKNIAVVAGCSLAKLGMKFRGHVAKGQPILEDVLAGAAVLLGPDDGRSPTLRLDSVGRHPVGAGASQQAILEALVEQPLRRLGLGFADIDKYATELHNPEVTEPSGSGNVPLLNYRLIAALAVRAKQLDRPSLDAFVERHGLPGYSPTQGHIASALPFLAHAHERILTGRMRRAMFLAKGSLFLGRMTQMSDGLSVILEQNPAVPTP